VEVPARHAGAIMSRWIVFDQTTADALHAHWGMRPELRAEERGEILQMVLQSRAAIAVGPAPQPGKVLLIRTSRPQPPPTPPAKPASNLAPAGFLGLSDSIDMDTDPESDRPKKWWQKILD
jgi:hypothetical protein